MHRFSLQFMSFVTSETTAKMATKAMISDDDDSDGGDRCHADDVAAFVIAKFVVELTLLLLEEEGCLRQSQSLE